MKPSAAPERDLAVDFYRVGGVVLIVLGHWLAGSVTYHDGIFGRQNPLVDQPWTQWLTWLFQAVPVFFLVAGYASAVSWRHRCETDEMPVSAWLRRRLARVLGPTAVYVGLVSVTVVALRVAGVARSVLDYAGWAVAMHLWFLAVYLLVVSLTPVAVAAQRRWGLMAPAVLAAVVVPVDIVSLYGHAADLGWLNYLLCWGALYQLGIAWQAGLLGLRKVLSLAVLSAVGLTLLIWLAHYPVSMIGVPGQHVENSSPPTVAMLAFAGTQAALAIAVAPAVNGVLRGGVAQRVLRTANSNVMALYLWHMVPVVIVAVVGYPSRLLPQPVEGTVEWWLARLEWVAVLGLLTAGELALLSWRRGFFAAPLPALGSPVAQRWATPLTLLGAAMSAYGLAFFAAMGFAPDGDFPWVTAVIFAAGALLVTLDAGA